MDFKAQVIEQYKKLKELNNGTKPLYQDFLKFSGLHKRKLDELYGSDAYSKLQHDCGDKPNKLILERTAITNILTNYGELVRKLGYPPKASDWIHAKLKPTPDAINKVNKLKWSKMPDAFIAQYSKDKTWNDVLEILNNNSPRQVVLDKSTKAFDDIIEKIVQWTPDRKRVIEEGYKIELRHYLNRFFQLDEEYGDSNADLVINGKYPIEIKKDPSQSEYDRLLGQMIRHSKLHGSAIAVVTDVSSQDRFIKFKKLFDEVYIKLGSKGEVIKK